jgi:hypothetical protein
LLLFSIDVTSKKKQNMLVIGHKILTTWQVLLKGDKNGYKKICRERGIKEL